MAKKKASTKKPTRAKKPVKAMPLMKMRPPPPWPLFGSDCNVPRICKYINGADGTGTTDGLRKWLADFWKDYRALRIAVCNVEKQAFSTSGVNAKPPKFCTGGGGAEPADPPNPPNW